MKPQTAHLLSSYSLHRSMLARKMPHLTCMSSLSRADIWRSPFCVRYSIQRMPNERGSCLGRRRKVTWSREWGYVGGAKHQNECLLSIPLTVKHHVIILRLCCQTAGDCLSFELANLSSFMGRKYKNSLKWLVWRFDVAESSRKWDP